MIYCKVRQMQQSKRHRFGNLERLLPDVPGRTWYECDINFGGGYRGGERIVFSDDRLIYHTDDHDESFTLLYE